MKTKHRKNMYGKNLKRGRGGGSALSCPQAPACVCTLFFKYYTPPPPLKKRTERKKTLTVVLHVIQNLSGQSKWQISVKNFQQTYMKEKKYSIVL